MMIADNTDGLLQIVETEPEAELRTQAIRMLASTGDHEAGEALRKIYPRASREEKQAIIEAMLIMDDVEALTGLLEQEDDPELKRYMLQMLSAMDSEEADEYLFQALERDR
jgi:HEAT repeat protein